MQYKEGRSGRKKNGVHRQGDLNRAPEDRLFPNYHLPLLPPIGPLGVSGLIRMAACMPCVAVGPILIGRNPPKWRDASVFDENIMLRDHPATLSNP